MGYFEAVVAVVFGLALSIHERKLNRLKSTQMVTIDVRGTFEKGRPYVLVFDDTEVSREACESIADYLQQEGITVCYVGLHGDPRTKFHVVEDETPHADLVAKGRC